MSTPHDVAVRSREERSPYPLALEPDGRSWTARQNLVDVVERELLGPLSGPHELLLTSPDVAYLVGRIAPYKLTDDQGDPADRAAEDTRIDVDDVIDADGSRGVPVPSVDESDGGDPGEDTADDTPQQRGLMIPASMGLRFQVSPDLDAFTVTTSWGFYQSELDEDADADGRRLRRFRRTPVEIRTKITLAGLEPGTTSAYPLRDDVVLRVDRLDDAERGCCIVEVALCNDRVVPRAIPVDAWLYQTHLAVKAGGDAAFLPVRDALTDTRDESDDELRRLNLQYRDRLEFAVGRTCSVGWREVPDTRRADAVWTTWLPTCETPQTTAEEVDAALLDMRQLAAADRDTLRAGLAPIVTAYDAWLDTEAQRADALPEHLRGEARDAVIEARRVQRQLADGLEHLLADDEALRCFRFMNQVMAEQRIQTQVAEHRASHPKATIAQGRDAVLEKDDPHSWRTFQLAFILMQLPLLTNPTAERRSGDLATAALLFFPTGGGKTEAYLGLAAYTFAIRRRQGRVGTADDPLDGHGGVAVLMRYTLRLLTAQQFQRATALVCAAEMARLDDPATWGSEPFRIGLWVGTDVSPKRWDEADEQLKKVNEGRGYRLTVLQIQRCPWCGSAIGPRNVRADRAWRRVFVRCSNSLGGCPFADGGAVGEGLPVLTVDEEIYRLAPAFLIATVDKFARLAREGEAASLFGYVSRRCDRHGFVHPDYSQCTITDGSKHRADKGLPAAAVRPVARLRPPDLIIQDELHLITGALGTTVGLFEVAVDVMTSWRTVDGRTVRPLLVASTATARNAPDQVRALYGRDTTIFPPQVLDAGATFFAKEEPVTADRPGRRYLGISATGVRLTAAEIRIAEVLMAGGQLLIDRCGAEADPYLTLVGYFSATRELAGMTRYLGDDIQTALNRGRPWSRLPRRRGTEYGTLHTAELTARVSSGDITATLDQMAVRFDPDHDSTAGKRARQQRRDAGEKVPERTVNPFDAVLATSMLQVGVDVSRLGLMLVVGQPKNTAEYIQASSRVGRVSSRPGLVVALGNWARPRDLAHFEQFRHYHETFYSQVEALSVTPFSITSMERGLDGVLTSAARVVQATRPSGLSPEKAAGKVDAEHGLLVDLVETLVARVGRAGDEQAATRARQYLTNRLDQWSKRRSYLAGQRRTLVYERALKPEHEGPLMISPENSRALADRTDAPPFVIPNSMREVQPEINLLVSPVAENLHYQEPPGTPRWVLPQPEEAR